MGEFTDACKQIHGQEAKDAELMRLRVFAESFGRCSCEPGLCDPKNDFQCRSREALDNHSNTKDQLARIQERERCAKIAESEPEAPGEMPPEFHLIPIEDAIRGAIRATKKSIAAAIRNGIK